MVESCAVCGQEAVLKCEGCLQPLYCGEDHKKSHSAHHKATCKPYAVERNSKFGRYLVTVRPVRQGELLMRESPVLVGPRVDSPPVCLECFTPLFAPVPRCPLCDVIPLCRLCSHSAPECLFFSSLNRDRKHSCICASNQFLLPLKVLLNVRKEDGYEQFRRLLEMESHLEARRGTDVWYSHQKNVVELLQSCGVIGTDKDETDLIQHICGILDVNSFEVRGGGDAARRMGMGVRLRGVYLDPALMAHDCVTNTHLSVDDNYVMTIRASVDIPEGQPIVYNYTDPLQTTAERQRHLQEGKYFSCSCQRCEDPTELGTYLSALNCPRCKTGRVLASPHPGDWDCEDCKQRFSSSLMSTTLTVARDYLDTLDRTDASQLEAALSRLSSTLASSHSLLLDLKQSIVAAHRDQKPTPRALARKVQLCRELLPVLRRVEPGISRMTGITLYELHIGLVALGETQQLREAEDVLKEALTQLLYEPSASPEGELARQAMHELKSLKQIVASRQLKDKKKKTNKRR